MKPTEPLSIIILEWDLKKAHTQMFMDLDLDCAAASETSAFQRQSRPERLEFVVFSGAPWPAGAGSEDVAVGPKPGGAGLTTET